MKTEMNKKARLFLLALGAALLTLVPAGCSDYDNGFSEKEITYQESFAGTFGNIAADQDWNAATRVTADIDLSGMTEGAATVLVFNANPISGGQLAAHATVSGTAELSLDLPKACTRAYVSVVDGKGNTLMSRYCDVAGGRIGISAAQDTRSAADASCQTTFGREVQLTGTYGRWGTEWSNDINYNGMKAYYLDNVKSEPCDAWTVKDMVKLVGQGGTYARDGYSVTFGEGYFAEGRDNKGLYADKFQKGIVYKLEKDGPVSISNMFGGTAFTNQFGYYYYKEGATAEQTLQNKLNARKIVLMEHAEPQNNITLDGQAFTDGMWLPNQIVSGYYNGWTPSGLDGPLTGDELVQGTRYHLVYFGDDYQDSKATFTFPKGYCIGFFIRSLANSYGLSEEEYASAETNGWNFKYSDPELNHYYGLRAMKDYQFTDEGDWYAVTAKLSSSVVTESQNVRRTVTSEVVAAGFEDGGDTDLNDILFLVDGVSVKESFEEKTVDGQTWVIGCEDLGGIGDFDFNDIVFGISHVTGDTKATIIPMAAGGTLPVYIYDAKTGTRLTDTEFHGLWGSAHPSNITINASDYNGETGTPVTFSVPADYTISYVQGDTNMGGIEIHVVQDGTSETTGTVNIVHAPEAGTAPQMVLIHQANWAWPAEGVNILSVYPDFLQFAETGEPLEWYNTVNYNRTVLNGAKFTDSDTGATVNTGTQAPTKTTPSITASLASVTLDANSETTLRLTTTGNLSDLHASSNNADIASVTGYDAATGTLTLQSGSTAGTARITILHAETTRHNQNYIQVDVTVNEPAAEPEPEPEPEPEEEPATAGGNIEYTYIQTVSKWDGSALGYTIDRAAFAPYKTAVLSVKIDQLPYPQGNPIKVAASTILGNIYNRIDFTTGVVWKDASGNTLSGAPASAGTYLLCLSESNLKQIFGNKGLTIMRDNDAGIAISNFAISGDEIPASGTTTYTGSALSALYSDGEYVIPASAFVAKSSCTITLTAHGSTVNDWTNGRFETHVYYPNSGNNKTVEEITDQYNVFTKYGVSSDTDYTFHVAGSALLNTRSSGVRVKVNKGSISKIVVDAQ